MKTTKLSLDSFKKQEISSLALSSNLGGAAATTRACMSYFKQGPDGSPRKEKDNDCH